MKLVMRKKFLNEKGFTLIEIIASLVILVIVGALVIISTIKITQGFVFTKMNAETSQKAHIALNRLTKEFTNIIKINEPTPPEIINFTSSNINELQQLQFVDHSVSLVGTQLLLDGNTLANNVSDFTLTLDGNVIEFTLKLTGANDNVSIFTTSVVPRNL